MKQIWQCLACKSTYLEYVNGCVHHGEDEPPHSVTLVVEVE